ncbi:MAG: radical SAM family heme chaperone HemW [Paludibacteraceae bacterium]|nr:radical SAM family heme chaperone HemW [Paludibacteraceae bacterium]
MAGIYIHIPFCKQRCHYCDFYSHTNTELTQRYLQALSIEMEQRKNYLPQQENITTLYLGGGTPSLLQKEELAFIFSNLTTHFNLANLTEITIEANPDDITSDFLLAAKAVGCNRLSIGIQSFYNEELQLLGRRHSAEQAIEAVSLAQQYGFTNISIDLMYGLPNQSMQTWQKSLEKALSLEVQHISAYHLTYEKGTPFYQQLQAKKIKEADEEDSILYFEELINKLTQAGFEHYEISNFALSGYESQHNSSYWEHVRYIGLGASAHSYNLTSRQWNKASIIGYCTGIEENTEYFELEMLTKIEQYNDFVITSLRTKKGVNTLQLKTLFGEQQLNYFLKQCEKYIDTNKLCAEDNFVRLTEKGIFVSDSIMEDIIEV